MKKVVSIMIGISLIALVLTGCSRRSTKDADHKIYYMNKEGTGLVEEVYEYPDQETGKVIDDILKRLSETPDSLEYLSVIPEGVAVLDYSFDNHQLDVNFNAGYGQMNQIQEIMLRAAFVKSLVQVSEVHFVAFYMEGEPLLDKTGEPVGLMSEEDFIQNVGSALNSYQTATLNLYFANKSGDKLKKQTANVRYNANTSMEKLIVEQLIKGPATDSAGATLPKNVKILSVSVKSGICYVNLDASFLEASYDVKPEIVIYSIVNSIIDGGSASQVQISVEGETRVDFLGSIPLDKPFERDLDLVEVKEND